MRAEPDALGISLGGDGPSPAKKAEVARLRQSGARRLGRVAAAGVDAAGQHREREAHGMLAALEP